MPYFMFQWSYKDSAVRAMVESPQDRPQELRKAVEAFNGKLLQFFYSFGAYDGLAIVEFPSNEQCAACALSLSGSGGTASFATTALMSAGEGFLAMERASHTNSGYRTPVGYASIG